MTNFTYYNGPNDNGIPLGTDNPSVSQPSLQQNCNAIFGILDEDLVGFNQSNGGTHNKSTYQDQTNNLPSGVSDANTIYAAIPMGGILEMFLQRATGSPIQLTSGTLVGAVSSGGNNGFQTFLPGNLLLKFGFATSVAGVVTFTSCGMTNFANAIYGVVITSYASAALNVTAYNTTGFVVNNGGAVTVFFVAWGY
jgi:hypothetical protein